jgi:drug/metabolite transporter (DMT)-like permease
MTMLLAAWGFAFSRRVTQVGFLLDGLGAGLLVLAALERRAERGYWLWLLLAGGVLLAAGFVLVLVALHWGVSPYSPRR